MLKIKGNEAEAAVIFELSKLGLPVFKELGDSSSVDLITIVNKRPVTIQVKYCEFKKGVVSLSLRKTGPGNYQYFYKPEDFDVFALYIKDTGELIWISSKEALALTNSISFRKEKSKMTKVCRFIKDYKDFYKALMA